ncbi:hypothetical protein SLEP1_g53519 [Rubroshorea leprosula]|uniref:Uncharacterized protein n=1 Tax=Rubroshorea leprosula TaxID=152421 RepID=A0AAV5M9R9_9ROSI|nr:hypothetical protein SLEP1_g53519 [Rubroshorea leprosula]
MPEGRPVALAPSVVGLDGVFWRLRNVLKVQTELYRKKKSGGKFCL